MLQELGPAGASSQGFISGAAGPIIVVVLLAAVFAVPAVREFLSGYAGDIRAHFTPEPTQADAAAESGSATGAEPGTAAAGRASDRDEYDFDLDLLGIGDACDVDAPPDR